MSAWCAGGCGGWVRGGDMWACVDCKQRLPREISQALFTMTSTRKGVRDVASMTLPAARDAAERWWQENPPPKNDNLPAWKRHSQRK